METSFQEEALECISITEIIPNSPCCSIYDDDKRIYRSVITDINLIEASATVHFIDYGNVSVVPFDSIFKLKENYLDLPKNVICSKLKDVYVNKNIECYETLEKTGPEGILQILRDQMMDQILYAKFIKEVGCIKNFFKFFYFRYFDILLFKIGT